MFKSRVGERGVGDVVEYARVEESIDGASHVVLFKGSVVAVDAT